MDFYALIRSFPLRRTVEHCGARFDVDPFESYVECVRCCKRIKIRDDSFFGPHLEDLFDAFFEWLNQPDALKFAIRRGAILAGYHREVDLMATVRARIGPADNGRAMTLDEFREADEEPGYRYELAGGVLEVVEVPNDPHGQIVSNLHLAFYRYKIAHPEVVRRIGGAGEFRLWIPEMVSGRNPDAAIVFRDAPRDDRGRRRPGLVVEVVSERGEDRDYRVKREEYRTFGVQEYWIVDPELRRVLVLARLGESWVEATFQGEDVIVSGLLPGFDGTVAGLWVDSDDED